MFRVDNQEAGRGDGLNVKDRNADNMRVLQEGSKSLDQFAHT